MLLNDPFLNLGCGDPQFHAPKPWLNVDCRDGVGADVVANILECEFGPNVKMVYLGHVVEHFAFDLLTQFLDDLLRPGRQICIVSPDVFTGRSLLAKEATTQDRYDSLGKTSGSAMAQGIPHLWDCSPARVAACLATIHARWDQVWIGDVPAPWPVFDRTEDQFAIIAERT